MKSLTVDTVAASDGTARAVTGPSLYEDVWWITRARVSCTVSDPMPRAWISIADANRIEGTYTGAEDTTDINADLLAGQRITAEWENAAPGSVCTLTILYARTGGG